VILSREIYASAALAGGVMFTSSVVLGAPRELHSRRASPWACSSEPPLFTMAGRFHDTDSARVRPTLGQDKKSICRR
jgi:hypothetical protein